MNHVLINVLYLHVTRLERDETSYEEQSVKVYYNMVIEDTWLWFKQKIE